MIYLIRQKHFILINLLLLFSCGRAENEINDLSIKNICIDSSKIEIGAIRNELKTNSSIDTLKCNHDLSYNQALTTLRDKFIQIDILNEGEHTKTYLKALLLSEFVYASFSFQFLGSELGKTNHHISIDNWDKMTLENCYNLANNNLAPVWCGDRTSFYIRLLDHLLGIKATAISIKDVHTFPIVNIGKRRFIFDPYDPFIIFDSLTMKVMDYDEAFKNCLNESRLKILRTKRSSYGFPNELISNKLTNDILAVSKNEKQDISQKLMIYLTKNKAFFLSHINTCSYETYNKIGTIYQLNLKEDRYIIQLENNLNNVPMSLNRFKKYYFGIDCK